MDPRDLYVERVVKGRSFIDVGGLWGLYGEKVSQAHRSGASELALLDETPKEDSAWDSFRGRMEEFGIPGVRCISANVLTATVRPYDVVHSSGVLYHLPNPLQFLARLRNLTRCHLVLTSAVFPTEGVENHEGSLHLPPAGALFIPALDETDRRVMDAHWQSLPMPRVSPGTPCGAIGINRPADFDLEDYAPFWWLPTPAAIDAMCGTCGFRVLESTYAPEYSGYTVLVE